MTPDTGNVDWNQDRKTSKSSISIKLQTKSFQQLCWTERSSSHPSVGSLVDVSLLSVLFLAFQALNPPFKWRLSCLSTMSVQSGSLVLALLCSRRGFIWGYKQSNLISASSVVSRPSVITWIRAEETGLEGLISIDPRRSNVSYVLRHAEPNGL